MNLKLLGYRGVVSQRSQRIKQIASQNISPGKGIEVGIISAVVSFSVEVRIFSRCPGKKKKEILNKIRLEPLS